jgi:hypothetical protein
MVNWKIIALTFVCIGMAATGTKAQEKNCRTISDPKERLACFDKTATPSKGSSANRGSKKLTDEEQRDQAIKKTIVSHLKETLFDPDSIKELEIGKPRKGVTRKTDLSPAGISGYAIPVAYNAKNRYGGYVGKQKQIAFVTENKVLFMFDETILKYTWAPVQLGE